MKFGYIEITNHCNLACSFCPSASSEREKRFMSKDLFTSIIRKIKDSVSEVYFHVLGEPTLHPELQTFFRICEENNLLVNLTTNGTRIQAVENVLLSASNLRQVNFSVHALEALPHGNPVLESIISFTERALRARPELYLNFRLWNAGTDSPEVSPWNRDLFSKLQERFGTDLSGVRFSRENKSVPVQGRLYLHLDSRFVWPAASRESARKQGTCLALKTHFAVLTDGRVTACCLDDAGHLELGNIAETSLEEILESPRACAMREGFRRKILTEPFCRTCSYSRRFGS
ncbi:MAG: SPASM domain-containing protein [Fibrobacter sp.]|jgi:radical SAM protein with 4Fe4S-binding SPASM domain|nr:SPASM domain-containing protein [Fibrobacter sp.]